MSAQLFCQEKLLFPEFREFTAIPKNSPARNATAFHVRPGCVGIQSLQLISHRNPYFLVGVERSHRIDTRRSARGHSTGRQRNHGYSHDRQ